MKPRHFLKCDGCPAQLERAVNVKRAVCKQCRIRYQSKGLSLQRRQAASYREVLLLLGVKDEAAFLANLRKKKLPPDWITKPRITPTVWEPSGSVRLWASQREKNERIKQVARDNPDMPLDALVERFGVSEVALCKLLSRAKIRRSRQRTDQSQTD